MDREAELHDLLAEDLQVLTGVGVLLPVVAHPDIRRVLLHLAASRADRVGYTARRVIPLIPEGVRADEC